jgi:hypothetical protein
VIICYGTNKAEIAYETYTESKQIVLQMNIIESPNDSYSTKFHSSTILFNTILTLLHYYVKRITVICKMFCFMIDDGNAM